MEANITADKQRTRVVGKVEQSNQNKVSQNQNIEQQMENISKRIDMLSRSVKKTLLSSKDLIRLLILVIFQPTVSKITQDQTDLITEISPFKEISSPGEVTHIMETATCETDPFKLPLI